MGAEGQHTRLKLRAGRVTWDAAAFDRGRDALPTASGLADVVYTLSVDHWGGNNTLQMRVLDIEPAR